jgi:hypothetical protein
MFQNFGPMFRLLVMANKNNGDIGFFMNFSSAVVSQFGICFLRSIDIIGMKGLN